MNNRWPTLLLEDICEFHNGLWKGKKGPYIHVGVIRNTNFTKSGFLDDTNIAYLDVEKKQFAKRQLQFGDLILEKSGGGPKQPVGRVIIFEKTEGLFSFSNFTSTIRIKNSSSISFRFLHRVLYWYYISGVTAGMQRRSTGIRNLNFAAYKKLLIPIPPISEQKRIVAILDDTFAAIATAATNTEKNITNAQELFESELNRTFQIPVPTGVAGSATADAWSCLPLSKVCLIRPPKREAKIKLNSDNEVSFIPMNSLGIRQREFACKQTRLLGKVYGSYTYFSNNDVLLAKITPCFQNGKLGIANGLRNGVGFGSSEFFVFRCLDKLTPEFLFYFFSQGNFINAGVASMSGAVGQQRVPLDFIQSYPISLPPIPKQKQIVAHLDKLSAKTQSLISNHKTKLTHLTELKQSLLHQSFSGGL